MAHLSEEHFGDGRDIDKTNNEGPTTHPPSLGRRVTRNRNEFRVCARVRARRDTSDD